jgi:hypothetical protein
LYAQGYLKQECHHVSGKYLVVKTFLADTIVVKTFD